MEGETAEEKQARLFCFVSLRWSFELSLRCRNLRHETRPAHVMLGLGAGRAILADHHLPQRRIGCVCQQISTYNAVYGANDPLGHEVRPEPNLEPFTLLRSVHIKHQQSRYSISDATQSNAAISPFHSAVSSKPSLCNPSSACHPRCRQRTTLPIQAWRVSSNSSG